LKICCPTPSSSAAATRCAYGSVRKVTKPGWTCKTGLGISPEQQTRIFGRFEQVIAHHRGGGFGVGSARTLYEDVYCARGQSENHIKAWKTHLAADRTSCCRAGANQMRLFLHIGAYWLMWSLRSLVPRRSRWRVAQFDTLRLRLIKIAARVEVLTREVRLHLPRATPDQAILVLMLSRLSRLVV
jgi:hypothetical protein